jgi:hypothetical protein
VALQRSTGPSWGAWTRSTRAKLELSDALHGPYRGGATTAAPPYGAQLLTVLPLLPLVASAVPSLAPFATP